MDYSYNKNTFKEFAEEKNLSNSDLVRRFKFKNSATVSNWLKGNDMRVSRLIMIANTMGIDLLKFFNEGECSMYEVYEHKGAPDDENRITPEELLKLKLKHAKEMARKEAELAQKEQKIARKESELAQKDRMIAKKDSELAWKEAEMRKNEMELVKAHSEEKERIADKLRSESEESMKTLIGRYERQIMRQENEINRLQRQLDEMSGRHSEPDDDANKKNYGPFGNMDFPERTATSPKK